jgi:hypothetical protein
MAVVAVVALSMCTAGLVAGLTHIIPLHVDISPSDNRSMALRPSISFRDTAAWEKYSLLYEAYYRDSFFLRNRLIRAYNRLHVTVLGATPAKQHALVGQHGWLFLPQLLGEADTYRPLPLCPEQLAAWKDVYTQRHIYLAAHGIDYFVMPLPDKQSIYTEYLPRGYAASWQQHSRRRQLLEVLCNDPLLHVVDVAEALAEAKARLPVYLRTDSHWNNYGAWLATQTLVQKLAVHHPGMGLPPPSAYTCSLYHAEGTGDLTRMLAQPPGLNEDQVSIACPVSSSIIGAPVVTHWNGLPVVPRPTPGHLAGTYTMVGGRPNSVDLLVRRDSFAVPLRCFLLGAVKTLTYDDSYLDFDIDRVLGAQPQVVVDMHVERILSFKAPRNPEEITTLCRRQHQFFQLAPLWEAPAAKFSSTTAMELPPSPGPEGLLRLHLWASGKTTVELYSAAQVAAPGGLQPNPPRQQVKVRAGQNIVYLRPPQHSEGQPLYLALSHPGESVKLQAAAARGPQSIN